MKRRFALAVVISNLFVIGCGPSYTAEIVSRYVLEPDELCVDHPDQAVASFEDANLEAAVRRQLSLELHEDLTCGLVSGLHVLVAGAPTPTPGENPGISSLVGIQNLTGLRDLFLRGNRITDLTPLATLTELTRLDLNANASAEGVRLRDLTGLAGLGKLTVLDLGSNRVADLRELSGLTSLTALRLQANSIVDVSPLRGLESLTSLYLAANSITDVGPLGGLTRLTTLHLYNNSISEISPLAGLTELTDLRLDGNWISDVRPLASLTKLTEVWLNENAIEDIGPLAALRGVQRLELRRNPIEDVGSLSTLVALRNVGLRWTALTDIRALASLLRLEDVDLRDTRVSCWDANALVARGVRVQLPECTEASRDDAEVCTDERGIRVRFPRCTELPPDADVRVNADFVGYWQNVNYPRVRAWWEITETSVVNWGVDRRTLTCIRGDADVLAPDLIRVAFGNEGTPRMELDEAGQLVFRSSPNSGPGSGHVRVRRSQICFVDGGHLPGAPYPE